MENPEAQQNKSSPDSEIHIESLSIGGILDHTLKIFKANWKYLLYSTFDVYIPYILSTIILFFLSIYNFQDKPFLYSIMITNTIVFLLCSFFLITRVIPLVSATYKETPLDPKIVKKNSFGYFVKVAGTFILYIFYGVIWVCICALVEVVLIGVLCQYIDYITYFIVIPLFFVFVYLIVKWFLARSLAIFLPLLEGLSGNNALKRSKELFYSNRESIIKVIFIPIIINLLVIAVVWTPSALLLFCMIFAYGESLMAIANSIGTIFFAALIITPVLGFIFNSIPIIAITIIYYDIRIRTEGFDIELKIHKVNQDKEIESLQQPIQS